MSDSRPKQLLHLVIGGELVVESEAGSGTTLTWRVPLVEG